MWDTRTGPASSVRLQKAAACFCCAFGTAVDFCSSCVNALPGSLERLNGVRGNVAAHDQTKQGYKTIEEEWPCHSDKNVATFASKLPSVNKDPTTWQNCNHATTLREQKQDRDPQKVHEKTTPETNLTENRLISKLDTKQAKKKEDQEHHLNEATRQKLRKARQ